MTSPHFLALSGDHGCLPDFFACCASKEQAVGCLVDLFELGRVRKKRLEEDLYLELDDGGRSPVEVNQGLSFGAAYCEIVECSADDLHDHLNDSEYREFAQDYPECIPQEAQNA